MKDKTWTFVDKSTWGDGPWQSEPDKVQFTDATTGLPCLVVRHPTMGHLCGYVGVGPTHPYYLKGYDDVPANVNGGLTFADKCSGSEHGICHVVEPGESEDVWWFGFDCAHLYDKSPGIDARLGPYFDDIDIRANDHYWTVPEVQVECANLAQELAALA